MAFKGTAGKSSSVASMSRYDVEVESRLQKLEAAVAALESHSHDVPAVGGGDTGLVGQRLDKLVAVLNGCEVVTNACAKGADGARRLEV